jgi:DnaK suppressor protein
MSVSVAERREQLVGLRARIVAAAHSVEHALSVDEESGEIATATPEDIADHATDTFDRELDESLEENAGQVLREIDEAMARLDEGTYGTCAVCGKRIPDERLDALPYATLCVEDRRRQEHG